MSKKQLLMDDQVTFNSEKGKNVLKDLRKRCPLMDTALDASRGIDTEKLCFLEGQRAVLLHIFKMIDADPYEQRQRRAIQESKNDEV